MTDYDRDELWGAVNEARNERTREVPWSLFEEAYGDNAGDHFLKAVDNGDVEVIETRDGIRMDGEWPRYHTGRLVFEVKF